MPGQTEDVHTLTKPLIKQLLFAARCRYERRVSAPSGPRCGVTPNGLLPQVRSETTGDSLAIPIEALSPSDPGGLSPRVSTEAVDIAA